MYITSRVTWRCYKKAVLRARIAILMFDIFTPYWPHIWWIRSCPLNTGPFMRCMMVVFDYQDNLLDSGWFGPRLCGCIYCRCPEILRNLPLLPGLHRYCLLFIKCLCIYINLSDLHLQLHLCDIDNLLVSHVLPEQSGHCLHAHPDPRLPVSATTQRSQSL